MRKLALPVLLTAISCATQNAPAPSAVATCSGASASTLNATLWMQTAAEYQALTREIYRTARTQLDLAMADPAWTALPDAPAAPGKPAAIILDLDETAIDTSAQTARQIRSGSGYSEDAWRMFSMAGNARAIPPALDFLRDAAGRGVAIFYITNRLTAEEPALRRNLEALGFPLGTGIDTVLTRNERPEWTGDKSSRRAFVAANYRVVELFGDDLNDFVAAAGKSLAERNDLLRRYDDQWGRRWFMLPNPMYGSWERALTAGANGDCAQFQKKVDALRIDEDFKP